MGGYTDPHCHLVPYVDDGAQTQEEAEQLLRMQSEQGVTTVCVTPHLRHGMFETPDEKIVQRYEQLRVYAQQLPQPVKLLLGREYYCDKTFLALLKEKPLLSLGNSKVVLIEFSNRHSAQDICRYVDAVFAAGYQPLVAHVERYRVVRDHPELLQTLHERGAYLQMNAEGFLGLEGFWQKRFCYRLLKTGLIDFIASDAHRTTIRKPNLAACATLLQKKISSEQWHAIFVESPKKLMTD